MLVLKTILDDKLVSYFTFYTMFHHFLEFSFRWVIQFYTFKFENMKMIDQFLMLLQFQALKMQGKVSWFAWNFKLY